MCNPHSSRGCLCSAKRLVHVVRDFPQYRRRDVLEWEANFPCNASTPSIRAPPGLTRGNSDGIADTSSHAKGDLPGIVRFAPYGPPPTDLPPPPPPPPGPLGYNAAVALESEEAKMRAISAISSRPSEQMPRQL